MFGVLGDRLGVRAMLCAMRVGYAVLAVAVMALALAGMLTPVMGVRTLAVYGLPLGLMGAGVLVARIGYPRTVTVCCAVGVLFTLFIGLRWRASMWRRAAAPRAV
jgi:hypothetical protein